MFKGFFKFLKSKTFFKHLLIYVIIVVLLLWVISKFLSSTTKHGETVKVPDFKDLKITELDQFVKDKKIGYLIIDSIYKEKSKKGIVIRQEPEAGADVKEDRKIYLYTSRILPPTIEMPNFVDNSLRLATSRIESYGLKVGKPIFKPDQCANCVLEQLVKGKKIAPGQPIAKGTVITLVVGKGLGDEEVGIPCVYGLSKKEAIEKLTEASLNIGSIIFDAEKDSVNSRVYRQIPACGKNVTRNIGSSVDLYLTTDKEKIPTIGDLGTTNENEEDFDE